MNVKNQIHHLLQSVQTFFIQETKHVLMLNRQPNSLSCTLIYVFLCFSGLPIDELLCNKIITLSLSLTNTAMN